MLWRLPPQPSDDVVLALTRLRFVRGLTTHDVPYNTLLCITQNLLLHKYDVLEDEWPALVDDWKRGAVFWFCLLRKKVLQAPNYARFSYKENQEEIVMPNLPCAFSPLRPYYADVIRMWFDGYSVSEIRFALKIYKEVSDQNVHDFIRYEGLSKRKEWGAGPALWYLEKDYCSLREEDGGVQEGCVAGIEF